SLAALQEELIHAIQDLDFYGDNMKAYNKDVEFEAKVLQDILLSKYPSFDMFKGDMGQTEIFRQEYSQWLAYINKGNLITADKFHYFSGRWETDYTGTASSGFTPELLYKYINNQ
ncbi:MAG: hypothetical protein IJO84_05615, partial [Butyricimonas sp.]|nr:hypothetical protein [Butyricimonas sp.]